MSTFALCVPFNCKYTIIILIQNIGRVFVSLPIRLSIALRIQKKKGLPSTFALLEPEGTKMPRASRNIDIDITERQQI